MDGYFYFYICLHIFHYHRFIKGPFPKLQQQFELGPITGWPICLDISWNFPEDLSLLTLILNLWTELSPWVGDPGGQPPERHRRKDSGLNSPPMTWQR